MTREMANANESSEIFAFGPSARRAMKNPHREGGGLRGSIGFGPSETGAQRRPPMPPPRIIPPPRIMLFIIDEYPEPWELDRFLFLLDSASSWL